MNDATLAQGNQMLNLILQKKTPAKNLQQLLASGLQSMLLDACNESNIATVNPFVFREILGLGRVDIIPYGRIQKLELGSITSINGFIEANLGGFTFDREPLLKEEGRYHKISSAGCSKVRLYAVDAPEIRYVGQKLEKADIESATLSKLVKFAFLNPMLEGWLSATVIAMGSSWNDPTSKYEYPFILYEHGNIKSCGRIGSNTMVINGYTDVNHRFFFLGSKM